jgi:hypothetical protein
VKNIILSVICFVLFLCANTASAQVFQQVCDGNTCRLVEVAPVRNIVSNVVDVVQDVPPVPVMYSVLERTAVRSNTAVMNIRQIVRQPVQRVRSMLRNVFGRFRIFRR